MKLKISTLLIALLALMAFGCGSTTDFNQISGQQNAGGVTPPPETQVAFLRLAHLSPDAPNVDVLVNGEQVFTNIPFETVSNYFQVPMGATRMEVRAAGTTTNVIDETVSLGANSYSTLAATGLLADIGSTVLTDDVSPVPGTVRARLVHAVPGVGPVYLTTDDGTRLLGPASFGQATLYTTLDEGDEIDTNSLQLRTADNEFIAAYTQVRGGQTDLEDAIEDAAGSTGINISMIAAGDGESSLPLIITLDQAAAGGQTIIADPAAEAKLRLAHLVPGGPEVNVFVNDSLVTPESLSFEEVSDYITVFTGDNDIRVRAADAAPETPDLFDGLLSITEGGFFTAAVILNPEGQETVIVERLEDDVTNVADTLRLRFAHTSPGVAQAKLAISGFGINPGGDNPNLLMLTELLEYGQSSGYFNFPNAQIEGVADLGFVIFTEDEQGQDEVLATFNQATDEGETATLAEAVAQALQENDGAVNLTMFSAGTAAISGQAPDEEIDLALVLVIDNQDEGGATVVSPGNRPVQL